MTKKRRTKAEMQTAREEEARAKAAAEAAEAAEKESISQAATSYRQKLTNHWSDEEQRELHHAGEVLQQMKQDHKRHREEWLTVIGPKVLLVCNRIFEVTGATSRHDQAYRNVVNETLAHYGLGLDQINRDTRSALLILMENIKDVRKFLAKYPNAERLGTPRTILNGYEEYHWAEAEYKETDPLDENLEYLGEEPEEPEEECAKCGEKTRTAITRAEGRYCLECHYANPEGPITAPADQDNAGTAEAPATGDDSTDKRPLHERYARTIAAVRAREEALAQEREALAQARALGADDDDDDADDSATDDSATATDQDNAGDYKPNWIPGIDGRDLGTIGELRDYIDEAIRKGAKPDNQLYVAVTYEDDGELDHISHIAAVHFCDADGPEDEPPFMVVAPTHDGIQEMLKHEAAQGWDLPANFRKATPKTKLREQITDLETKLAAAVAERERLYSENASLKLIIQGLQRQEHTPPTVPADDDAPAPTLASSGLGLRIDDEGVPHVHRKVYGEALKKHGNKQNKVTLADLQIKDDDPRSA